MIRAVEGLKEVWDVLSGCGIEDSRKEAELILSRCIGIGRVTLYRDNPELSAVEEEKIKKVLERRQKREPIQYIIGDVDFYGLNIVVGPGVLIPRPETEHLVDEAIKAVTRNASHVTSGDQSPSRVTRHELRILDLCTGSGCIALSLARHFPLSAVVGVDISEKALQYAQANAVRNGIKNVSFINGNMFEPVEGRKFDIIVSNPPYIKRREIEGLDPEIKLWEPCEALDGGEDGLQFYRDILLLSPTYLADGGSIIIELGKGEAGDVVRIAEKAGFRCVSVNEDYTGIERVLHLTLSSPLI